MQTALYQKESLLAEKMTSIADRMEGSILKVLAYFAIFQYPLTKKEIKQFLDKQLSEDVLDRTLQRLVEEKNIFRLIDFYSLQDNLLLAEKRIAGNRRAEKLLQKATRIGRFLYQFPFVSAIGISGSLSKNYADERADIDFFIVTKANRLWIARTFMHIFKKITYCTGSQHLFCMNYYIDEANLLIEDENVFTALEIKTLLPVSGEKVMDDFFTANNWSTSLLPACSFRRQQKKDRGRSWFKQIAEWLFNNKMGDRLDNYLVKITTRRWKKKEEKGQLNQKGQPMGLITGKHFARSNPDSFQEKILSAYHTQLSVLQSNMPQWFDAISLSFSA